MTEDELCECKQVGRMLAEIEQKLAFWKHQREISDWIVEKLAEKQTHLHLRQQALIEGKAKAAAS